MHLTPPKCRRFSAYCPSDGWLTGPNILWQNWFIPMKLTCIVARLPDGKWLAQHTGLSNGQVEVTALTREEALMKMRDELQYRIELCPCSGAWGDTVVLEVWRKDGGYD